MSYNLILNSSNVVGLSNSQIISAGISLTFNAYTLTLSSSQSLASNSFLTFNAYTTTTALQQTSSSNSLSATPPFPPLGSSVNGVVVRCNLIDNPVAMPNDVLDCFPITSQFGSNINFLPISDNNCKMKEGKFSKLLIWFNDQNFNILPMQDPNVLITLLIKLGKK